MDDFEDFDEKQERRNAVRHELTRRYRPVELRDAEPDDLRSIEDIDRELSQFIGAVPRMLLTAVLRECGFQDRKIGGLVYWLLRAM